MLHDRSSGDPTADSRFAYAMDYKAKGDLAAAAELVEQALERAPGWAVGWFSLGDLLEATERRDDAIAAFRKSRALDAADEAGAGARLARLGAIEANGAMTPGHVAALFDDYAARFETSLVHGLGYRVPALLLAALRPLRQPLRFGHAIDLGCGTGLAGDAFHSLCASMDGVDLSGEMLALAGHKQIYRLLERGDVADFLAGQPPESADLILGADVFVYIGDLGTIFEQAARVLEPGGLFAFSVQRHVGPEAFILNHDMRYAHSPESIETWARDAGLAIALHNQESGRMDRGQPVSGMIVVLAR